MTPFIGVRISWLIAARNSDLALVADMASAAIDLARTIIRRAERNAVRLREEKIISDEEVLHFLNRLADLLFTLARYEEAFP
jgi:cob(I)alamin adenosyltransferase